MGQKKSIKEAVLFVRLPSWLHTAVKEEAERRGLTASAVAREVLAVRFADPGAARAPARS